MIVYVSITDTDGTLLERFTCKSEQIKDANALSATVRSILDIGEDPPFDFEVEDV